ncbi:hypothetical protein [Leptolyngbya sp. 7M]|uniref:hypothetical protein n=1 Tax=Leptolyngbya sp. 7M TaxID=2812896 RepID=UPI001B8BCEE0|nr:hypothetical protein [Leptolyngbya sp. 7M]QYO65812.1 hypothetical protein JVX88_03170 [Leptolyngbya sp. 7M]
MKINRISRGTAAALTILLTPLLYTCLLTTAVGQRPPRPQRPPRVEGQTPIGTMNGQPVTANDLITTINTDSPFMPPLDGSPAPALQQFENQYPANPTATPQPGPVLPPKPPAPSFSEQIKNLMLTGQQWLFRSVLDAIVRPLMPILTFLAWIVASFVLIVAFIRRFHDNRGIGPEQLVAWGVRTIIFMVVIGASPFIIDALTITGKFFARPVRAYNRQLIAEFDEKMKQYVRANFAVEDPNELLAERLPNGEPGLVGIITDKNSSVKDITSEMNVLGWDMPRMFTFMVIGQNIIKFGAVFLSLAGLFILIGLKLAAPVLSAFGFDEKFANQIFYPFCWGVATFAVAFPIVKEITLYVCYGIGLLALSIYNGESVFSLDPTTAQIITNGNYDPASSALIVTIMFFVSSLCFILVPWLSYRVLRGQVYEGVSQISMGWMLTSLGAALETYGIVAGAAIHRQAENTQIQGIYNAEQMAAKKALEAANQSVDARLVSSVAGVEGGLVTNLGQIRANQVTQTLMAEANKTFGLLSSSAATRREITGMKAEAQGTQDGRIFDAAKETSLRSQGMLQNFGMMKYEFIPGGTSIAGTTVPVRKGVELYDWSNDQHVMQDANKRMNSTTLDNTSLQNSNTQNVADKKIDASNTYQGDINKALDGQASQNIAAINQGSGIAASSSRQGAGIQLSGIRRSADMERVANQLNFDGRSEAASINQTAALEAARLRMVSTIVTGFFRDMDRRLEEMKPKY